MKATQYDIAFFLALGIIIVVIIVIISHEVEFKADATAVIFCG